MAASTSLTCEIPSGAAQFRHFPFIVRKFYGSFCAKLCLRPSGISQVMSTPAASLGDTILRSWILQKLLTRYDELIDYEKVCESSVVSLLTKGNASRVLPTASVVFPPLNSYGNARPIFTLSDDVLIAPLPDKSFIARFVYSN